MNMRFLSLLILGAALLAGCKPNASETKGQATDSLATANMDFLQQDFYKQMKGKTQSGSTITLHIVHRDTAFSGQSMEDESGATSPFEGATSDKGEIQFFQFYAAESDPAFFTGHFTNDSTLVGEFTDVEKGTHFPIQFVQSKHDLADLSFTQTKKVNCLQREETLKNPPKGDIWWTDTICSYIHIDLIAAKTGKADVDALVNAAIIHRVCDRDGKQFASIDDYLSSIDKLDKDAFYGMDHDFAVITNESNILCLSHDVFLNEGGAHPWSGSAYLNFDLLTGKLIALADILKPNSSAQLNAIAGSIYHGIDEEVMGTDPDAPQFKLNDNFTLTKAGLRFKFAQYEIGSYAEGMPEVLIPYSKIEDLLLPGGVVARLRGK
jgi:Protein of unknown function (DUF3298)